MMENLSKLKDTVSRSVSPENFTGEKGKGGMAIHGTNESCARDLGQGWKISPSIDLQPGETFTLADIHGQGLIRHIWIVDSCEANRKMILRMYWDGSEIPSVEAPMCDFFACAEYQTEVPFQSALVCMNPRRTFNCYFDMPFYSEAKITLENRSDKVVACCYQIDYHLEELHDMGYFHAQYRQITPLPYKQNYTILENVQGKGQCIGTYLFWTVHSNGWWGEGEIKFYMDGDKDFPTICGTGTEDYFCGSYNFDVNGQYTEFCTPYSGLNRVIRPDGAYNACTRFSLYRWHITDPIYFAQDLRVTIQALGWQDGGRYLPLRDDICSVAYFYLDRICQTPPTLPTDEELRF